MSISKARINLAGRLMSNILNWDEEDIGGVAPPKLPIRQGGSGQSGGWPENPKGGIIGRGGRPVPVGDKKKKKPKGFAR